MRLRYVDHVQLAMPRGAEDRARAFYGDVLGLTEAPKPAPLAARGGVWFEDGDLRIHLGVEDDFRPARKAHPAIVVEELAQLVARCEQGGYEIGSADPLPGYDRAYIYDPFGNRIEVMEPRGD